MHEFNFLGFALEYDTLAPGYQGTHCVVSDRSLLQLPVLAHTALHLRAGLTERPEDVELLPFSIVPPPPDVAWTHNTVFIVELLQFAPRTPSRASSSIASCL
jgi:hypothetical protein